MPWTVHTDQLIDAMITTIGTPTGGLGSAVVEAYPTIWFPTADRMPALFIEFYEMRNTAAEGQFDQEYVFHLYYCMDRRSVSNPVRIVRDRIEEIAQSLARTPRLGVTTPAIVNSYPTRLSFNNEVQERMAEEGQDVIAGLVEFTVRVAEP